MENNRGPVNPKNKYTAYGIFDVPKSHSRSKVPITQRPAQSFAPPPRTKKPRIKRYVSSLIDVLFGRASSFVKVIIQHKKKSAVLAVCFLVSGGLVLKTTVLNQEDQPAAINPEAVASQDLPKEPPKFDLAYPVGRQEEEYEVVRVSPDGAAPSYAYLDRFNDTSPIFRVTQQEVPDDFNLSKVAKDFQATNVIQVDKTIVYHGYNEEAGVQSLMFEEGSLLVLIRSPQKFSDDTWASYIAAMN